MMRLCCVISGTFPASTAEMIDSYNIITLYVAITDSIILDHILGRNGRGPNFTIGSFVFSLGEEYLGYYTITYNGISLPFQFIPIYTLNECGPQSNLNFVEFIWDFYMLKCKLFAITAVPFDDENIRVLYLKHHRAASDGWTMRSLCYTCSNYHKNIVKNFVHNFDLSKNCTCNLYLRQPPSLRGLASQAVFRFMFNIEQFELSHETTYDQFVYAVHSRQVPLQNLIPNSYPKLNCRFTKELDDNSDHRLHLHCANETGITL